MKMEYIVKVRVMARARREKKRNRNFLRNWFPLMSERNPDRRSHHLAHIHEFRGLPMPNKKK